MQILLHRLNVEVLCPEHQLSGIQQLRADDGEEELFKGHAVPPSSPSTISGSTARTSSRRSSCPGRMTIWTATGRSTTPCSWTRSPTAPTAWCRSGTSPSPSTARASRRPAPHMELRFLAGAIEIVQHPETLHRVQFLAVGVQVAQTVPGLFGAAECSGHRLHHQADHQ